MTDEEKTAAQVHQELVAAGKLPSDEDLRAVARGDKPKPWRQAYDHPVHGELVFQMELPNATDMARHSVAMDNLAVQMGLATEGRGGTMFLLAAIAGLETLVTLPVVREERETSDDEDDPRETVTKVYYNPRAEFNEQWLARVWTDASLWRAAFVEPGALERLGKSSGRTAGSD